MSDPVLRQQQEEEYNDYLGFLRDLINYDDLNDKVEVGVTKKFISDGIEALSDKQKYVFKRVAERFPQPKCGTCLQSIPWSEAYAFMHEGGHCSSCQHHYEKFMRD